MATRDEPWPEGTPSWADLMVPDRHTARDFYGRLFGWEFTEGGAETGYYMQGHYGGRPIAGIGEAPPGEESPPPAWTTYLATDDADAAARRIGEAGGTILLAPMEVGPFGRMAVATDPTGAVFGLWQPGEHIGARIVNEPGTMCWNEEVTGDLQAAKAFYRSVFGYEYQDLSGPGFEYVGVLLDGQIVGGLGAVASEMEVPPHWLTYFAVEDTDATAAQAVDLGATLRGEPRDSSYGRMAFLTGLSGEVFAIIRPADPEGPSGDATSEERVRSGARPERPSGDGADEIG